MNTSSIATLAELKDRLEVNDTSEDGFLQSCLDQATSKIHTVLGRLVVQTTHTDYHSGDGTAQMWLNNGPIANIGSVVEVSYDTNGSESYTTLTEKVDYFVHNSRDERTVGRGWLERYGTTWLTGTPRNYRVVYQAGWDQSTTSGTAGMPHDLKLACMHAAVWLRQKRKDTAKTVRGLGSATASFRDEKELERDLRTMLAVYLTYGDQ